MFISEVMVLKSVSTIFFFETEIWQTLYNKLYEEDN